MRSRKIFLCLIVVSTFFISSCKEDADITESGVSVLKKDQSLGFSADEYAKAEGFSDRSVDRKKAAYDLLAERFKIAKYLENKELDSDASLKVDLANSYQKLVLDRYFDLYLKQQLTDDAVKAFFESNKERFVEKEYVVTTYTLRTGPQSDKGDEALEEKALNVISSLKQGKSIENFDDVYQSHQELNQRNTTSSVIQVLEVLQEGEFSKPVKTRVGVQFYKLEKINNLDSSDKTPHEKAKYELQKKLEMEEYQRIKNLAGA